MVEEIEKSSPGMLGLDERVLSQGPGKAAVEFRLPLKSPYFDGHFPGFKILPAVAQLEMALRLADRAFGCGITVGRVKRLKFTRFIRPGDRVRLDLSIQDQVLSFTMTGPDGAVLSTGALTLA